MKILVSNTSILKGDSVINGDICITDGIITSVGEQIEGFAPDKIINGSGKLCIPGLINSHTHMYMSLFRNYADDVSFSEWLFKRIFPLEDKLCGEDAYWGSMLSCIEMIRSGTTTFCDMHLFPCNSARAALYSGMRGVISRAYVSSGGNGYDERIAQAMYEYNCYKGYPTITFMIAPHAIYTCDEKSLRDGAELALKLGLPINIHLSESQKEFDDCMAQNKKTPVEYVRSTGIFQNKTIAAHCVYLTDSDIQTLAECNVSVAHNPKSNLKLGNGIARIKDLTDSGVNVALGTDSAASNNSLNMFSEMNFASLLPKGKEKDGSAVSAASVFSMATENGAKALCLPKLGKIEEGYKADIAILGLDHANFKPFFACKPALCYSATGSEVETVIIDGRVVMENKTLTQIDEEQVYYNISRITKDWAL